VETIKDNSYEDLAMEFQYKVVGALDEILKKKGIGDKDRLDICGELSFDLAMILDDRPIELGGKEYQSTVCFESDGKLFVNAGVLFHEYAFGVASGYFEEQGID
jgi:hypothetical protein